MWRAENLPLSLIGNKDNWRHIFAEVTTVESLFYEDFDHHA